MATARGFEMPNLASICLSARACSTCKIRRLSYALVGDVVGGGARSVPHSDTYTVVRIYYGGEHVPDHVPEHVPDHVPIMCQSCARSCAKHVLAHDWHIIVEPS